MNALHEINPSLHRKLSCMKWMGVFTWILGWGVYSNARNIAKIKNNLHILQEQNQLQDKQIKQLAKLLNLTMHQVNQHSEMLYELDTKMTIMNKTIQQIMWSIDILHYETIQSLFLSVCPTVRYEFHIQIYESISLTGAKSYDYPSQYP